MHKSNPFDADYFLNGIATGKSNYVNYRWLPELTMPLAERLIAHLGMKQGETCLDFGAARGFLVKALRTMGILAYGFDISDWAIANADDATKPFLTNGPFHYSSFDFVISKDVLEHIPPQEVVFTIDRLIKAARKKVLIIVPLRSETGLDYVREEDKQDATHLIRWTLPQWMYQASLADAVCLDTTITGSWHIPGLKPTSAEPFQSCGFIEISRPA